MKKIKRYKQVNVVFFMILLSFFICNPAVSAESKYTYAIFSMNPIYGSFSKGKARMIYRGKIKSIGDHKILLSDWPDNAVEKTVFYDILLGQTLSQVNGYWASLAFSGKAKQPSTIISSDVAALVEWLQIHPNGIGYAPLSLLPKNANILVILSKEY